MKIISLDELQKNIKENVAIRKDKMEKKLLSVKKKNLKKGRVRPKDPTEERILDRFRDSK